MPDRDPLVAIAADVDQLVNPITVSQRPHSHHWDRNNNKKPCTHPPVTVTHPPLLDQLAAAAYPGPGHERARRGKTTDRPPINVDAVDTLVMIQCQIVAWRDRLHMGAVIGPERWRTTLLAMVGIAPTIAPSIAADLAADVHRWWRWAALQAGWRLEDLQ